MISIFTEDGADPAQLQGQVVGGSYGTYNVIAKTSGLAGDIGIVANRLASKPLVGRVLAANGRATPEKLDAVTFLGMVFGADLNPGLAAVIAIKCAVHLRDGCFIFGLRRRRVRRNPICARSKRPSRA